jgi:hypothetical protein
MTTAAMNVNDSQQSFFHRIDSLSTPKGAVGKLSAATAQVVDRTCARKKLL